MGQIPSERLTTPLIRENGKHRPATWEVALDRVADGIRKEVGQHGPRTFGMFSCSKATNELNYTAQKFVRSVIGSTTSIVVTELDMPRASPVWRRSSARAGAQAPTAKLKIRTSFFFGAPTRAKLIPSFSITF